MKQRTQAGELSIHEGLAQAIRTILEGTGLNETDFWSGAQTVFRDFTPRNRELLAERDRLQAAMDEWHRAHPGQPADKQTYHAFLREIGYLVPEGGDFAITTENVDPEIATIAGPQLVVPATNARFALNAANARWGSLYDALYGSDVIEKDDVPSKGYDPKRGQKVMAWAAAHLDTAVPLAQGSHSGATGFEVVDGPSGKEVAVTLTGGKTTALRDPAQFTGYTEEDGTLKSLLLAKNGLHIELQFDPEHPVGRDHPAGVKDVVLESAMSTILDCEDSVAVVDGEDKGLTYLNLFGLIKGDLTASFDKGGRTVTRTLSDDRTYNAPDGGTVTLPGRSMMLVRTVGHLMTTDAVLLDGPDGPEEVPEGILDTLVTGLIFLHDLKGDGRWQNSKTGSVYIVKPKMHGPKEVAFTCELFAAVEKALNMPALSLKVGIMDEERRTTLNLKECIRAAKDRVIFINTGFLDRHGGRNPHGHGGRARGPQGGHQERAVDRGLRGLERGYRPGLRFFGQGPDRQGHVGQAGHAQGDGRDQGRAPHGRGQLRLGALAHGGHPARPALPPGGRLRTPAQAGREDARLPGYPDHPAAHAQ